MIRKASDLSERIARTRSLLTGSTQREAGFGKATPVTDRIGDGLVRIDEWEAEKLYLVGAYLGHVRIVDAEIDKLPDLTQQRILRLRYMDGMTWEEIGAKTRYSRRHSIRLHDEGLEKLGILKDGTQCHIGL